MKTAGLLALLVLLGACAGQSGNPPQSDARVEDGRTACTDPRPMVCTLEYNPTCGFDADGSGKDFASPCNACADAGVLAFRQGACQQ